ncbi:hypothetical protein [Brevundimonas bacteroides]|uniref:hypothetical protein n=1 Tax=Brevundimonas bacteroides TaxID=74311 RepID=UPI000494E9D2|nr:hypothetical protein [Brevundimonas bacteroides]
MGWTTNRAAVWAIAVAVVLSGCQTTPLPQVEAWLAAGGAPPPPQSACPGVAHMDLNRLAEQQAGRMRNPRDPNATGFVELPASAEALIPADAVLVIRANLPPSGMYQNDLRTVVWKAVDGTWGVWRQNRNYGESPPPPPPPPDLYPAGSAEQQAAVEARDLYERTQRDSDLRWPPESGQLPAETAQAIEAALADPCRAWDPAHYPYDQPLRRREAGNDRRICPPDGGVYLADITEPGRPRRPIISGCINDTPTFRIISAAAYAMPEA